MSLIPFILDLADELQEYQRCLVGSCSAMDVDDVDFGLQSLHEAATQQNTQLASQQSSADSEQHQQSAPQQQQQLQSQSQSQQQPQQQQQRRPRLLSQLCWPTSLLQKQHQLRHHPYQQNRLCCNAKEKEFGINSAACGDDIKSSIAALANKPTAYPVINKNGWMMVSMNVKQFAPNELIVKTIDNCIIVEGRHEDKEDIHGVISRHFIRKYMLPKGYDPNEVVSTLSSDGILTVKAPPPIPPKPAEETLERIVDIQQTGPTHLAAKNTIICTTDDSSTSSSTNDSVNVIVSPNTHSSISNCGGIGSGSSSANVSNAQSIQDDIEGQSSTEEKETMETDCSIEQQKCALNVQETEKMSIEDDNINTSVDENIARSAVGTTQAERKAETEGKDEVKVECVGAVEKPPVIVATEKLAESAKLDMQVNDVVPAKEIESKNSIAVANIPMTLISAVTATAEDVATDNGAAAVATITAVTAAKASTVVTIVATNIGEAFSNNSAMKENNDKNEKQEKNEKNEKLEKNEKNGIIAEEQILVKPGVAVAVGVGVGVSNAPAAVTVTGSAASAILPAEVPTSLDMGICIPKSIVIDAAAALTEEQVASTLDGNGIDANGAGGVISSIETITTGSEELVAN